MDRTMPHQLALMACFMLVAMAPTASSSPVSVQAAFASPAYFGGTLSRIGMCLGSGARPGRLLTAAKGGRLGGCLRSTVGPVTMSSDAKEETSSGPSNEQVVLWADGLAKTYDGQKFQFRDATFVLAKGERVGLIGVNGVGKSTLLKILSSKEPADKGSVTVRKGSLLAYVEQVRSHGLSLPGLLPRILSIILPQRAPVTPHVPQDPLIGSSMTVSEALYSGNAPAMVALREYEVATAHLSEFGDEKSQVRPPSSSREADTATHALLFDTRRRRLSVPWIR